MKNLKKLRLKKGMTLEDVASKSGVRYATVAAYESGKRNPSVARAGKIAAVLDCTIDELTG